MTPAIIPVRLAANPYDIAIASSSPNSGASQLVQLGIHMSERGLKGRVLIVSNPVIFKHYGEILQTGLEKADFQVASCIVPAGEHYKTPRTLQKIYDAALDAKLERSSTIVALGGGGVGDMAGFAAATWLRGLSVVQVPTTLLAMVDAAIGGKTGVNHPGGKNLIGAFHQPRLVWIDPAVLATLPAREFRAAIAEVIKYGVIQAPDVFEFLDRHPRPGRYQSYSPEDIEFVVRRSAQCKAEVVEQDEREGGVRAILNYGHTVGHAVESLTKYRRYRHGEAVGLGMVAAGELAAQLGWWQREEAERQQHLTERVGLPASIPTDLDLEAIAQLTSADKKVKNGRVRFVLPKAIGRVEITSDVSHTQLMSALQAVRS
ncbi:MAG: 3-dehydroquinate synthase [Cyanobacteria bacterium P01_D01_bin.123]